MNVSDGSHNFVDRLITVTEAAAMLGMSVRWVWLKIAEGVFHPVKPSGNQNGRTRLRLSEVQTFIANLGGACHGTI